MLFNYKIISKNFCKDKGELKLLTHIFLDGKMDVFNGHFNDFPLLPAVAQLYFVEKIAKAQITVLGKFEGMSQVKFMAPILPNNTVILKLNYDLNKKTLKFEYELDKKIKSKGLIKYN